MPTQPLRPISLPNMANSPTKDLGISVKGNDILKRTASRKLYKPAVAPPPTPRITLLNERPSASPARPPSGKERKEQAQDPLAASWRPSSAVRRLGELEIPTVEESTDDMMELVKSAHALRRESAEVNSIKSLFSGIVAGDIVVPPSPAPQLSTRSVACSPLSDWSCMSEDLLQHVSQRVALEQQMPSSTRMSIRNSRPASSRPASRASLASSRSGHPPSRPPSQMSYNSDRPRTAHSTAASSKGPRSAVRRPSTAREQRSRDKYRDSLSETGISLPPKIVERLVSSYSADKLGSRPVTACSAASFGLYDVMREKVNKGYNDMVSAFRVYDKIDRGYVTRDQFKRVLRHFTVDLNRAQVENLLQRSDLVDDWNCNRLPYRLFLDRYMERGRSGYIRHSSPVQDRPGTADTQFADIAEARLFAQLHSDFVDVLEKFRSRDEEETGCVQYSDFKNIMSDYGVKVGGAAVEPDDMVNYVDYLNSVTIRPDTGADEEGRRSSTRPQTAPAEMALSHTYTAAESDHEVQYQQLSLNLRPVYKDPRQRALVKIENCKFLKGGQRKPKPSHASTVTIQGQIQRLFGTDTAALRRVMQNHDTARDGTINIGTFRDLLHDLDIKVDDNDFYSVVSKFDTSFKGVIPYRKFLRTSKAAC